MNKNHPCYSIISAENGLAILSTYNEYFFHREAELNQIHEDLKICTIQEKRRSLRKRRDELIIILENNIITVKQYLITTLGIKYSDIDDKYKNIIDIKLKVNNLRRITNDKGK